MSSATTSSRDSDDNVIFAFDNYIDVPSLQATVVDLAIRWLVMILGTFALMLMLNYLASILIKNSQGMNKNRGKQATARSLLLLDGIIHWLVVVGFYSGVVLWHIGFTTIFISANRTVEFTLIDIIILVLTFASWVFVISGILRGFRAFHVPDGRNRYILLPNEAPELYELLTDIASHLKTTPINEVRLVPDTQLELYERGAWLPFFKRQRILVLGMASLQQMTVSQFTTLVTSQYQLFQHHSMGSLTLRGRDNMRRMIEHMQEIEYDNRLNFIWYSFQIFQIAYDVVTFDAVKLHSLLVDCTVAEENKNLHQALTHLEFTTLLYKIHKNAQINASIANRIAIFDIYSTMFIDEGELERAANQLDASIVYPSMQSTRYPPTYDRLCAISETMPEPNADVPTEPAVLNLFADPDGLKQKMTILILRQIPKSKFNVLQ